VKAGCVASHSISKRGSTSLGVSLPTDDAGVSAAPLILSRSHSVHGGESWKLIEGIADISFCLFRISVV